MRAGRPFALVALSLLLLPGFAAAATLCATAGCAPSATGAVAGSADDCCCDLGAQWLAPCCAAAVPAAPSVPVEPRTAADVPAAPAALLAGIPVRLASVSSGTPPVPILAGPDPLALGCVLRH